MQRLLSYLVFPLVLLLPGAASSQWKSQAAFSNNQLQSMFFTSQKGYAGGADGIFYTSDGGTTWKLGEQFSGATDPAKLYFQMMNAHNLWFTDALTGYSAGWFALENKGIIIKTTDGGISWKVVYLSDYLGDIISSGFTDLHFVSKTVGYAVGARGLVVKTTDAGTTWKKLSNTEANDEYRGVRFINEQTGIVGGENKFMRTTDGGNSWTSISTQYRITSLEFISAGEGFATTETGEILHTTNGGQSWKELPHRVNYLLKQVTFTSATTGYILGIGNNSSYILKTEDAGKTWFQQAQLPAGLLHIRFSMAQQGYAVGEEGTFFRTSNGGDSPLQKPVITDFQPREGLPGTRVQIKGKNFGAVSVVKIGVSGADFYLETDSTLEVIVPGGASSAPIALVNKQGTVYTTEDFNVLRNPVLNSLEPDFGQEGDEIILQGVNLSYVQEVLFNGIAASFTIQSDKSIAAKVPAGNASGVVTVISPYGQASSSNFTKYAPPVLTDFFPKEAYQDSYIYLLGNNFTGTTEVKIGEKGWGYRVVHDTLIQIWNIYSGTSSGRLQITNKVGQVSSAEILTLKSGTSSPKIRSFSPKEGMAGTYVRLYGQDLSAARGVRFGNASVSYRVVNDTTIRVQLPYPAQTNHFQVNDSRNTLIKSTEPFTVLPGTPPPVIYSFSPEKAVAGAKVTFRGEGFYAIDSVTFGGIRISSGMTIGAYEQHIRVPSQLRKGKIRVYTKGGMAESPKEFVAIPNYCVPPITQEVRGHLPVVAINNLYQRNSLCKSYIDATHLQATATAGDSLYVYFTADRCTYSDSDQAKIKMYADWNNDGFFDNETERLLDMTGTRSGPFSASAYVPETAAAQKQVRMRVVANFIEYDEGFDACGAVNDLEGQNIWTSSYDYLLNITAGIPLALPKISTLSTLDVTIGSKIYLKGYNLAGTRTVLIDNVAATFRYQPATASLEVIIPKGASSGVLLVINEHGPYLHSERLTITQIPVITNLSAEADTVGAVVDLYFTEARTRTSLTNAYINGQEVPITINQYREAKLTISPNATSGYISLKNRFGTYQTDRYFTVIRQAQVASMSAQAAAVTDTLLLQGTGFDKTTKITFGGMEAVYQVVNNTTLKVRVPPGAARGPIAITNKAGTGYSADFRVISPPNPARLQEIEAIRVVQGGYFGLHVFDYNNDGNLDMLLEDVYDHDVMSIYAGDGKGGFEPTGIKLEGWRPQIADYNLDGMLDIYCSKNGPNGIYVYINKGDGSFQAQGNIVAHIPNSVWNDRFYVNDYDQDGDYDVWFYHKPSPTSNLKLACYRNMGQNSRIFEEDKLLPAEFYNDQSMYLDTRIDMTWTDVDGDGDLDWIYARKADDYSHTQNWIATVYLNTTGKYSTASYGLETVTENMYAHTWEVFDYNADGYPDLIARDYAYTGSGRNNLTIFKNEGGTHYQKIDFGVITKGLAPMQVSDYDNDGKADLLVSSNNRLLVYEHTTADVFEQVEEESAAIDIYSEFSTSTDNLAWMDFDNDGDHDLFFSHAGGLTSNNIRIKEHTLYTPGDGKRQRPLPPSDLQAKALSDTSALFSWQQGGFEGGRNAGESYTYNLYVRDETANKDIVLPLADLETGNLGMPVQGNAGGRKQRIVTGLKPGHTYSWQIQSINLAYVGSVFTAPQTLVLGTALHAPSTLVLSDEGKNKVKLSWQDNSADEDGFIIEYKTGNTAFARLTSVGAGITNYISSSLACGQKYEFRVQAVRNGYGSVYTNTVATTITGLATPEISYSGGTSLCPGGKLILEAPAGFAAYAWSNGASTQQIAVTTAGTYTVQVTDGAGCQSPASAPVQVDVQDMPDVEVALESGTLQAVLSQEVTGSYQWYLNDDFIAGATQATYIPKAAGQYTLGFTLAGCTAYSAAIDVTVLGIRDQYVSDGSKLYPNPAQRSISLYLEQPVTGSLNVEIVSMTGAKLGVVQPQALSSQEYLLNVSHLQPGEYFCYITTNKGLSIHRLTVVQ